MRDGRVVRNVAAVCLVGGLFAGTFGWQSDDTWPLAQMRMFPGGSESAIAIVRIRADLVDGRTRDMNPFDFHLKRAELEGQMNRVRADPRMLEALIERYNRTVPEHRRIVRIVLVRQETIHANGKTTRVEKELVRWPLD